MARVIGDSLPEGLLAKYRSEAGPGPDHEVITMVCIDGDGWPRPLMVSRGELMVADARHIRVAIWRKSTASSRLRENPKITLILVDGGGAYYVKGIATEVPEAHTDFDVVTRFDVEVQEVTFDHDPNGAITTEMRFEIKDEDAMRDLWSKVRPGLLNA